MNLWKVRLTKKPGALRLDTAIIAQTGMGVNNVARPGLRLRLTRLAAWDIIRAALSKPKPTL
jgi:hypothetical protein